jgi:hypothetical protein
LRLPHVNIDHHLEVIVKKTLHQNIESLPELHLALLVKIAYEALNNTNTRSMIGKELGIDENEMLKFTETVVDPVVADAETTLTKIGRFKIDKNSQKGK